MAADCQIDDCGVQALGRCATCRRAFCLSHRAPGFIDVVTNLCVTCDRERWLNDPHRLRREQESAAERFLKNEAATMLRAAAIPCLTAVETTIRRIPRRILFRTVLREEWLEVPTGDLWMVGKHDWEFNDRGPYGGTDIVRKQWTALFAPTDKPDGEILAVTKDLNSQKYHTYGRQRYRFRGSVLAIAEILRDCLTPDTQDKRLIEPSTDEL